MLLLLFWWRVQVGKDISWILWLVCKLFLLLGRAMGRGRLGFNDWRFTCLFFAGFGRWRWRRGYFRGRFYLLDLFWYFFCQVCLSIFVLLHFAFEHRVEDMLLIDLLPFSEHFVLFVVLVGLCFVRFRLFRAIDPIDLSFLVDQYPNDLFLLHQPILEMFYLTPKDNILPDKLLIFLLISLDLLLQRLDLSVVR
jgi:hypothetical protein